jgi:general secretion pathway protein E
MVGEIRDKETAEIAVQASLTGHLVLSTLHTNSAIGAITRLVDMGIEPFLLSSSLLGVLAQRLVRVLCPHCKEAYQADEAECKLLGVPFAQSPTLYHARGCAECHQQGYRGRTGIYELVVFDDHLRTLIHNAASEQDMTRHARSLGPSIREDGRRKVLEGATTVEEVLRVTREE